MRESSPGSAPPRAGRIIGGFLGVFGTAVLVAIAFTPGGRGKLVNLICGLTILGAAALFHRLGADAEPSPVDPDRADGDA